MKNRQRDFCFIQQGIPRFSILVIPRLRIFVILRFSIFVIPRFRIFIIPRFKIFVVLRFRMFEEKTFSSKFSLCADSTYLDISAESFGFLVIKLRVDEIENYFEMFVAISQKSQKERTQRCIEWECRRNKILRKEMTRSTRKHLSKLGQDRHVFVTYHHPLTHPLT